MLSFLVISKTLLNDEFLGSCHLFLGKLFGGEYTAVLKV